MNPFSYARFSVTMVVAMGLNIAPWPEFFRHFNPDWVLLVLLYWTLATPERVGIFNALLFGLFTDVLTGRLLGEHALTYSLVSYFCLRLHKRLRQYGLVQQGLFIFGCQLVSQALIFWVESSHNPTQFKASFWFPLLAGTLLWPVIFTVLRVVRQFRSLR